MKDWIHVFVVYRLDYEDSSRLRDVTIKYVYDTEEEAKEEVERLNKLNSHLGCEYQYQSAKKKSCQSIS
jgi:hypothetical protein